MPRTCGGVQCQAHRVTRGEACKDKEVPEMEGSRGLSISGEAREGKRRSRTTGFA